MHLHSTFRVMYRKMIDDALHARHVMITSRAVDQFLKRVRGDVRPLQFASDERIASLMRALPTRPTIWNALRRHQRICFLIGATRKRFAFFNDTGTGKTLLSIALISYFNARNECKRALVLVPRLSNKFEWQREVAKHAPDMTCCVLTGSTKTKWQTLEGTNATIVVETYAGFVRMLCRLEPKPRAKKERMVPDQPLAMWLTQHIDGIILDESTAVANHASLAFRLCRFLRNKTKLMFLLTGTPFGRDPQDLWSQMYLVDEGHTLGETLGLFRAAFFRQRLTPWSIEYKFIRKKDKLLHDFLAHGSIRYEADASDLPRVVAIKQYVTLPRPAHAYYKQAQEIINSAKGDVREMKAAFLHMRQISSGFVGYKDDETGAKAQFVFPDNPKLDLLLGLLEGIRVDRKVIVFHEFHWSGERIAKELTKLKINHVHLYGPTAKDAPAILSTFEHKPDCRVLLLSNAMAIGLNLQVAKYGIFFESPVSARMRKQAQRRVERQESQHSKVFIYDLLTRNTVDERILEFHREGGDLLKAIIDRKVQLSLDI